MRLVKISAIWCSGCLVMNKVWEKLKENCNFDFVELDYDMDEEEVLKYNPGDVLPVFILFSDDKEILRIVGEVSYEEFIDKIKEVGDFFEESN